MCLSIISNHSVKWQKHQNDYFEQNSTRNYINVVCIIMLEQYSRIISLDSSYVMLTIHTISYPNLYIKTRICIIMLYKYNTIHEGQFNIVVGCITKQFVRQNKNIITLKLNYIELHYFTLLVILGHIFSLLNIDMLCMMHVIVVTPSIPRSKHSMYIIWIWS